MILYVLAQFVIQKFRSCRIDSELLEEYSQNLTFRLDNPEFYQKLHSVTID